MIAEQLRSAIAVLLFQLREKISHCLGVIARLVRNDGTHGISLSFIFARILHQHGSGAKLDSHARQVTADASSQDGSRQTGNNLCYSGLGRLLGRMLHIYVRHLMSQHACQLSFIVSRLDGAKVYEDWSSRQCKGVDVRSRYHVKLVRPGTVSRDHGLQLAAQLLNIACGWAGIGQHRHLLIDLSHGLKSKLLLLLTAHAGLAWIGQNRGGTRGGCLQRKRHQ